MSTWLIAGVLIAGIAHPAGAHDGAVSRGQYCRGSESAIGDNLPLGSSSTQTDIAGIETIVDARTGRDVGWLYITRRKDAFIQAPSDPSGVIRALRVVGAQKLATSIASRRVGGAYYAVPASTVTLLRQRGELRRCFR